MIEIDMEQVKALHMKGNEEWHLRNLNEWLARLPEFIRERNKVAVDLYWLRFCQAEYRRLGSRARIMEQHGIEEYPHSHKEKERAIFQQVQEAIAQVKRKQREQKWTQTHQNAPLQAQLPLVV